MNWNLYLGCLLIGVVCLAVGLRAGSWFEAKRLGSSFIVVLSEIHELIVEKGDPQGAARRVRKTLAAMAGALGKEIE